MLVGLHISETNLKRVAHIMVARLFPVSSSKLSFVCLIPHRLTENHNIYEIQNKRFTNVESNIKNRIKEIRCNLSQVF